MNSSSNNISLLPFTPSTFPKISLALLLQSHAHLSMLQTTQGSFQLYHIYISLGFSCVDSHTKNSLSQIYLICVQRACLMLEIHPQCFQMNPAMLYNQLNFLDSLLSFLDSMLPPIRSTSSTSDVSPAFNEFRNEAIKAMEVLHLMKRPIGQPPAQPPVQPTFLPQPSFTPPLTTTTATTTSATPFSQLHSPQYQPHFVPLGYYPTSIQPPMNNDVIPLPPMLNFMPPQPHFFPPSSPPTPPPYSQMIHPMLITTPRNTESGDMLMRFGSPRQTINSEENSSTGDISSDNCSSRTNSNSYEPEFTTITKSIENSTTQMKQKGSSKSGKCKKSSPQQKSEDNLHSLSDQGSTLSIENSSSSVPLTEEIASDISLDIFLAHIRKTGVDFISPMNLQDIVLACIFSILKEFKCFNIKDIIDRLVLLQTNNLVPELNSISKTKIRGLIALMRHCDIIVLETLEEDEIQLLKSRNINRDIRLNLSKDISSLKDLRRMHDAFLVSYGQSNNVELSDEALYLVVWDKKKWDEKNYYHGLESLIERNRTFFQRLTASSDSTLETSVMPTLNNHKSNSSSVVRSHQSYSQDKASHTKSLSSASTMVVASQPTPYPLILINPTTYQPNPSPYLMYPYSTMRIPTYSAIYADPSHCITAGYSHNVGPEGY